MEIAMQKEKTLSEKRWEILVEKFSEIPDNRKTASPENLRWFLRSGAVMARDRVECSDAVHFAQRALDDR